MYSSKNAISHTGPEFRAVMDMNHCRTIPLEPERVQTRWVIRCVRPSFMILALLCALALLDAQLVNPALAKNLKISDADADAAASAKQESIRNSYAKRKASVISMLESGRKFDIDNRTSHAEFATAESMLREAETLAAANRFAEGKDKLDRAYVLLKNTLRNMPSLREGSGTSAKASAPTLAKPADDPAMIEKKKRDYEKLASSVQTMAAALKQESNKAGVNNADILGKVEANSQEADRLAKSGNYDGANQALDMGYHMLTSAIVKLENARNKMARTDTAVDANVRADAADSREYVLREIETSKALLAMLKHLNEDKGGGKEKEIAAIKATAEEASAALQSGDVALARNLIQDANSRSKKAIASLQKTPDKLPDSVAAEVKHHLSDDAAKDASAKSGYAKHKESVVVLLQAGRRIDSERHTAHAEFDTAESMIKEADTLAAANKFDKGNDQLDRTYVLIKNTMRKMLAPKDEPKETQESPVPAKPRRSSR